MVLQSMAEEAWAVFYKVTVQDTNECHTLNDFIIIIRWYLETNS